MVGVSVPVESSARKYLAVQETVGGDFPKGSKLEKWSQYFHKAPSLPGERARKFCLLIPILNLGFAWVMCIDLAKAFGKKPEFGFGIFFLCFIFHPILAFGDARYVGSSR